jgi:HAD superfamily hydrolase (TIGR01509 family)
MSLALVSATDPALLARPGWLFDCDGTLAATMRLHHGSWTHAIGRQLGRPFVFDWAFFCSMGGMSTEDTCVRLRERHGLELDPGLIRTHTDEWLAAHLEARVEARPEVVGLLHHVRAAGARTAVASGGTRHHVGVTLRKLRLEPHFDAVVTCEDAPRSKPHPDLFLEAARRIGIPAADCVVIEDSPRGREAAEAAGMACVMVEPA